MTREKTIGNEVGSIDAEVLIVLNEGMPREIEELDPIGFNNDRFRGKVNIVPSFFHNNDKDFKRIYLN